MWSIKNINISCSLLVFSSFKRQKKELQKIFSFNTLLKRWQSALFMPQWAPILLLSIKSLLLISKKSVRGLFMWRSPLTIPIRKQLKNRVHQKNKFKKKLLREIWLVVVVMADARAKRIFRKQNNFFESLCDIESRLTRINRSMWKKSRRLVWHDVIVRLLSYFSNLLKNSASEILLS